MIRAPFLISPRANFLAGAIQLNVRIRFQYMRVSLLILWWMLKQGVIIVNEFLIWIWKIRCWTVL